MSKHQIAMMGWNLNISHHGTGHSGVCIGKFGDDLKIFGKHHFVQRSPFHAGKKLKSHSGIFKIRIVQIAKKLSYVTCIVFSEERFPHRNT